MKVEQTITTGGQPAVVTIGFFDGLHLGHQSLIQAAAERAKALSAEAWMLTFDRHPASVTNPGFDPTLLCPRRRLPDLLASSPLDGCMMIPFTPEFAAQEPEAFIELLVTSLPGLKGIVVGPNWRFGKKARGDTNLLKACAEAHGFEAVIATPVMHHDEPVSSTRIRNALLEGHADEAAAMLGRPYTISGTVISGKQLGRTMGIPTANFLIEENVLPLPGIYAARAQTGGQHVPGALYIGRRQPDLAEIHLLDFNGDLYGTLISVGVIQRIRDDQSIPGRDELIVQIQKDIQRCRELVCS